MEFTGRNLMPANDLALLAGLRRAELCKLYFALTGNHDALRFTRDELVARIADTGATRDELVAALA